MYTLCITSAFPMFRGMNVLLACYIAFLLQLLVFQTCHSSTITAHCAPSSCGNIQNISFPFRLNTDPQSCGNNNYALTCENNISTVLYLYSGKYYVQAIDYGNFTIRVVDAGVQDNCCSIPRYSLAFDNFSDGDPYTWYNYKLVPPGVSEIFVYYRGYYWGHRLPPTLSLPVIFMSCENTVNSPLYVDTAPYGLNYGSGNYSNSSLVSLSNYVTLGGMTASDLMELCSIEKIFLLPKKNYTDKSFFTVDSTPTLQTMRKSTIHRWRESNRPRKEKAVELTWRAVCSQMETVENETNEQPLS